MEPEPNQALARRQPAGAVSRVRRSTETARRTYDRLSRWYDLLADASERHARELGLALLNARPGERALEIGCGTGHALVALAQGVAPGGRVVGLDLSSGMLRVAERRLARHGLLDWVELRQADAAAADLHGPFDAIFMGFTLELFDTPDIPRVLGKCLNAMRGGGRIAVVALTKPAKTSAALRLYEWLHHRLPAWFDCRPIYPTLALERAGFQLSERRQASIWGLPVEIVLATRPPSGQHGPCGS